MAQKTSGMLFKSAMSVLIYLVNSLKYIKCCRLYSSVGSDRSAPFKQIVLEQQHTLFI